MKKYWFVGSIAALLFSYFLYELADNPSFRYLDLIGQPLALMSLGLLLVLFLLLFFKEQVFIRWQKFALKYIPISLVVVLLISSSYQGGSFGPDFGLIPDPEAAAFWVSGIFLVWSLILILKTSLRLRKEK